MPVAVDSIKYGGGPGARRADTRRNEPEREQEFLAKDPRLQASIQLQKELTITLGGGVEAASETDREAAKRLTEIIDPYGYSLEDALHLVQLHGADTESLSNAISQLVEEHLQKGFICEWKSTNRRIREKNAQSGYDYRGGRRRYRPQHQGQQRPERSRRGRLHDQENTNLSQKPQPEPEPSSQSNAAPTPTPTPTPTPVEKEVGEVTTASSTESRGKVSTWARLLRSAPSGGRSKSLSNADKPAPELISDSQPAEVAELVEAPPTQPPPLSNVFSSPASTLEEPAPPEPLPEAKMLDDAADPTASALESRNQSVPLPDKPKLDERHPVCDTTVKAQRVTQTTVVDFPPPPSAVVIPPSATAFHHKAIDLSSAKPSVILPSYLGVEEAAPNHVSYIFGSLRWDGEKPTRYEPPPVPAHQPHHTEPSAAYRMEAEDDQHSNFRSADMSGGPPYYPNSFNQPQAPSPYAPMWQSSTSADYNYANETSAYGAATARQDPGVSSIRRQQPQQPSTRQPFESQAGREDATNFYLNSSNRPLSIMGAYGSALTRSVLPPPYSMNVSANNTLMGMGDRQKTEVVRSGLMTHAYDPNHPQHLASTANNRNTAQTVYQGSSNPMYMTCPYQPYGNGPSEDSIARTAARSYPAYESSGAGLSLGGFQQGGQANRMPYATAYANSQYDATSPAEASATGQSWATARENTFVQAQAKRVMLSSYNHGAFDLTGADPLLQQANPLRMDAAQAPAAPQSSFPSLSNPSTLPSPLCSSYPRSYAAYAYPPGLPNYTYDRHY